MDADFTHLKVACHCGQNVFQVGFITDSDSLPIAIDMCHCNTCRHSSGVMYDHSVPIHGSPALLQAGISAGYPLDVEDLEIRRELLPYKTSPHKTRFYCRKCSAYIFSYKEDRWCVSTGVLERVKGVAEVGYHGWVEDTLDGGFADHYRTLNGQLLPRYKTLDTKDGTLPLGWKADRIMELLKEPLSYDSRLSMHCICGSVNLIILPPPVNASKQQKKDWELCPPLHPSGRLRYTGAHCFCDSCRLISGAHVTSWVFIPRCNILDARTNRPISLFDTDEEGRTASLIRYESTPGVFRESCGTCGAGVVYYKTGETEVLDMNAGLLDQEQEGARAARWIDWRNIVHPEDAKDLAGLEAVRSCLKGAA